MTKVWIPELQLCLKRPRQLLNYRCPPKSHKTTEISGNNIKNITQCNLSIQGAKMSWNYENISENQTNQPYGYWEVKTLWAGRSPTFATTINHRSIAWWFAETSIHILVSTMTSSHQLKSNEKMQKLSQTLEATYTIGALMTFAKASAMALNYHIMKCKMKKALHIWYNARPSLQTTQ